MTRVVAASAVGAAVAATLEIDLLILFCLTTHTHLAWASGRAICLLAV